MRALIVEDEKPAANNLQRLLSEIDDNISVENVIDSVEDTVKWLSKTALPDVIFLDIQLADGLSFDIFEQIEVNTPIVFTTAFDKYAIEAFRVNSIDYLLKPINKEDLSKALSKLKKWAVPTSEFDYGKLTELIGTQRAMSKYKERFLVKLGDKLHFILTSRIRYFYSETGVVFLVTDEGKKFMVDGSLDHVNNFLSPKDFFRINRQMIISPKAIQNIHAYFNSRLKLDLLPKAESEIIVSRERVNEFKVWLGG